MRCPRCSVESPGPYCSNCGTPIATSQQVVTCPRCGTPHALAYCPTCAFPSPNIQYISLPRRRGSEEILSVFWTMGVVLMFLVFAVCLAALVYSSASLVFPALNSGQLDRFPMLTIFPQLEVVFYLEGATAVTIYFALIVATLLGMYAWLAFKDGRGVLRSFALPFSSLLPRLRTKNRWIMVAQLFLAVQFFQLTYALILMAVGIEITGPPGAPTQTWEMMLGLAEAPVYEELASRVALIGFPMFFVSIVIRSLNAISGDIPPAAKGGRSYVMGSFRYLWGGTIDRKSPRLVFGSAAILSAVSALFFSAAHSNYGLWKLLPTFVAGLALAYAYLRGGLFASILLHFAVNMFSGAALLAEGNVVLLLILGVMTLAVAVIGSGFFAYYVVYVVNLLGGRFSLPSSWEPKTIIIPTPLGTAVIRKNQYDRGPIFATTCPFCGWNESAYSNGRLRCLNCGKER